MQNILKSTQNIYFKDEIFHFWVYQSIIFLKNNNNILFIIFIYFKYVNNILGACCSSCAFIGVFWSCLVSGTEDD